jgi:hypothetical protein
MDNAYVNRDCSSHRMADQRVCTDYRPSAELHSSIRYHNRLYDSNQYRQFMINNAEKMMDMTRNFYADLRGCKSCQFIHPDPSGTDSYWAYYRKHLYGQPNYQYDGKSGYQY